LYRVSGAADGQHRAVGSDEKAFVWSRKCASERLPCEKVFAHFSCEGTVEWHPSRSAFEHPYKQHASSNINIAESKLQSLAEADAGAIEEQQKHPV
jgi:hypothetical protein